MALRTLTRLPDVPLVVDRPVPLRSYLAAVVLVAAATFLTDQLSDFLGTMRLFFYWVAVLLSGMLGIGPGLLATALASIALTVFVFSPSGSVLIYSPVDMVRLLAFIAFAGGIAVIAGSRRVAERRLTALSDWLTLTMSSIADAVIATDTANRVVFMNAAAERLTGRSAAQARGQTLSEIMSGVPRDIEESTSPIVSAKGTSLGTVVVFRDVTELRRRAAESDFLSRASALLGSSLDVDTTLRSLARLCVPELADWCAIDMAREGGGYIRLAVEHSDPAKARLAFDIDKRYRLLPEIDPIVEIIKTGKPQVMSDISDETLVRFARDDEHLRIARELGLRSWIMVPMTARARTLGVITLVSAESGRRFTEADLPLLEELARRAAIAIDNASLYRDTEKANRAKDEFLATLSHELRTPLTAIMGWANMMQMGGLDAAATETAIETIAKSAKAQGELIDDLLDISRVVAGKLQLDLRDVDLVPIVREVIMAASPAAQAKRIQITVEAAPELIVFGDSRRLAQVVWNLVWNAVKFTDHEGRIVVSATEHEGYARIQVRDNGRGIDPAFLPFVWERFRQADSTAARQHGGLGLGLALVRHLTELHGGTVRAESEGLGKGSLFEVRIPVAAKPR